MDNLNLRGGTYCAGDMALIAGATTKLTLSTAKDYCVRGLAHTQATTTDVQQATTDYGTGAAPDFILPGYGAVFVIGANDTESTTLKIIQGPVSALGANSAAYTPGDFAIAPQFPAIPEDFCPFGYVVVKVATDFTAAGYKFGTSNTTATGAQNSASTAHANTFTSVMVLPSRPVTA